jgi:3-hydroxymyristoyl/3-hydroxydecanoyl-(acyl carrier protein) dehydratase
VPEHASFFGDHFPRRPVFPATLLLDLQMRLAIELADSISDRPGGATLPPPPINNVKIRTYLSPGEQVGHPFVLRPSADDGATARIALSAHVGDRAVATARVELVDRVLA